MYYIYIYIYILYIYIYIYIYAGHVSTAQGKWFIHSFAMTPY